MSLPVNSLPVATASSARSGGPAAARSSSPGFDAAMQDALQHGSVASAKLPKHDDAASAGGAAAAAGLASRRARPASSSARAACSTGYICISLSLR